jgi:hypothetical protein
VARHIYDNSLGGKAKADYIDSLWNDENSFWQVLFNYKKLYFMKQLAIEIIKLEAPEIYDNVAPSAPNITPETISIEKLSLYGINEIDKIEYKRIRDAVFAKHTDADGFITCPKSGFKSKIRGYFQIDHIKPMFEGGLTMIDNLQVLSRKAHAEKTSLENRKR